MIAEDELVEEEIVEEEELSAELYDGVQWLDIYYKSQFFISIEIWQQDIDFIGFSLDMLSVHANSTIRW